MAIIGGCGLGEKIRAITWGRDKVRAIVPQILLLVDSFIICSGARRAPNWNLVQAKSQNYMWGGRGIKQVRKATLRVYCITL